MLGRRISASILFVCAISHCLTCLSDIEVKFKQYGLKSVEVIDNGSGVAEEYHESIGTLLVFSMLRNL